MKKRYVLFTSIITALIFMGCNPETNTATEEETEEEQEEENTTLGFIDITDTDELFISNASLASSSRSVARYSIGSNKLYKMKNGKIEEVKEKNTDKEEMSLTFNPTKIIAINDDYVLIVYGSDEINPKEAYIVRKSDGAVFSLGDTQLPISGSNGFKNQPWIVTDKQNNFYYYGDFIVNNILYRSIVRVNLSDPNNLTAQVISPDTENVRYFFADDDGNILYNTYTGNNTKYTVIKANGGRYNVAYCDGFWKAPDGYLYYDFYDSESMSYKINKITVDSEYNVSTSLYYDYAHTLNYSQYYITLKNKVYSVTTSGSISKLYDSDCSAGSINLSGLTFNSVSNVDSTDNYYYICGSDASSNCHLVRINPTDNSYVELLTVGEYDVYSFTVSETDGVTFNALRMSDGKKVVGTVGIDGTGLSIIDEESGFQVTSLTRIK